MFWRVLLGLWFLVLMTQSLRVAQVEPLVLDKMMLRFTDAVIISSVFGNCGRPCVVHTNNGGYIIDFELAADALARSDTKLVIDGDCYSACAVAADLARTQTCITHRAAFHFHQASVRSVRSIAGKDVEVRSDFGDPPQSPPIDAWIKKRGGYPKDGFLTMRYAEAKKFWQTCGRGTPLPKPDPRRAKARRSSFYLSYLKPLGF